MQGLARDFSLLLLAVGATPTVVLGLLGWVFREKWKQMLARSLNADTEQIKLKAQQDMEAYKVSLIASVERQKAHAELKKALAVKHAMLEYEAICALHGALVDALTVTLANVCRESPEAWDRAASLAAYEEVRKAIDAYGHATEKARLFLTDGTAGHASHLNSKLRQLRGRLIRQDGPLSVFDCEPLMTQCRQLQDVLRGRVTELTELPGV